jgi:hypothetical protein
MKMQKLIFNIVASIVMLLSLITIARAQSGGGCYPGQVIAPPQPIGLGQPVPGAIFRVCSSTATGTPCNPLTPGGIFSDPGLLNPLSNPSTADQNGNYNFCASQGSYLVQESPMPGVTYSFLVTVGISPSGSYTFSGNNTFTGTNQFSGIELSNTLCTGALSGFSVLCATSSGPEVSINSGGFLFMPTIAGDIGGTSSSPTVVATHITGGTVNTVSKFNATGNQVPSSCTDNGATYACTEPISSTGGISATTGTFSGNATVGGTLGVTGSVSGASGSFTGALTAGSVNGVCLVDGANTRAWVGSDVGGWLNSAMAACNEITIPPSLGTLNVATQIVFLNKPMKVTIGAGTSLNWTGGAIDMIVMSGIVQPVVLAGPARVGPAQVGTPPIGARLIDNVAGSNTIHITQSGTISIEGLQFDGTSSTTDNHILMDAASGDVDHISIMNNVFQGKLHGVNIAATTAPVFDIYIGAQNGGNRFESQAGDCIISNAATTGFNSVYIENNFIEHCGLNFINLFGAAGHTNVKIRNNVTETSTVATGIAGIAVNVGSGVEVSGNDIEALTGANANTLAILLTAVSGGNVFNNTIFNVTPTAGGGNGPINLNSDNNITIGTNVIRKGTAPGTIAISDNSPGTNTVLAQSTDFGVTYSRLGVNVQVPYISQVWTTAITGQESAAPAGVANFDNLYSDSTAHRWKMINNNGTATTVAGFSDYTLTLKKGSGSGNYTSASTTYVVVDSTNLCYTVTIPTGFKLSAAVQGTIGSLTAAVQVSYALTDNAACSTANAGILQEDVAQSGATGTNTPFSLGWAITGDGASHNIALQYKTSAGADSVTIANASATLTPTMVFTLMPSN